MKRTCQAATLLSGLWLASSAVAASPTEDAALLAAEVTETHCTAVAGGDSKGAGQAMQPVTEAWVRVSAALEASPKPYLIYWRGVLAQCLSQEERAEADLVEFGSWFADASASDRRIYAQLDRDARSRLLRLRRRSGGARVELGPVVGGVAGVGAGVALGGLAAWQGAETQRTLQIYVTAASGKDFDALLQQGESSHAAAIGLAVGAGVAAAAGTVLLALSAGPGGGRSVAILPVVSPSGGAGAVVAGRW